MKISSVTEMRELDRTAIKRYGIKEELLMENAGEATYFVMLDKIGIRDKKFVVLCGGGNNGGDGFVIARKIHSNGGTVRVFLLADPEKYKKAAKLNYEIIQRLDVEVQQIDTVDSIRSAVSHCDAVVDAIFGTGLVRDVGGLYRDVIRLINESGKTVVSVDIPSGINGDNGKVMGTAVQAGYTVTFGLPKIGTMLFPGFENCGQLYVTHISFPPALYNKKEIKVAVNIPLPLPKRQQDGHKGSFGDVLFIAGAATYFGAPLFSARSFLKAGGGYSRLAAPETLIPFIANQGSEIVFVPQKETFEGSIALENKPSLFSLSDAVDMVVLGPGLSLNEDTQQLSREMVRDIKTPILIDGDGITALSADLDIIKKRKAPTILTPHLGEMSRITKCSVAEVDEKKIPLLRKTAQELDAIIVLKGAHSLIGIPDGRVFVNLSGNAGMATAGSGDVLTGTIAAMYGLGLDLEEAVKKGVFIHGLAGDLAAQDKGEDGITAQDILDYLPQAMKQDRNKFPPKTHKYYYGPKVV